MHAIVPANRVLTQGSVTHELNASKLPMSIICTKKKLPVHKKKNSPVDIEIFNIFSLLMVPFAKTDFTPNFTLKIIIPKLNNPIKIEVKS